MAVTLSNLLSPLRLKAIVHSWLEEDVPSFDFGGFVVGEKYSEAQLLIKSPGVVAGIPFFSAVFNEIDCEVEWIVKEGDYIEDNLPSRAAIVRGKCKNILLGERVALNCICRASGIASTAMKYIKKTQKSGRLCTT